MDLWSQKQFSRRLPTLDISMRPLDFRQRICLMNLDMQLSFRDEAEQLLGICLELWPGVDVVEECCP